MGRSNFDRDTVRAVQAAVAEADRRDDPKIGTEHLLLGVSTGLPRSMETLLGAAPPALRAAIDDLDLAALGSVGVEIEPSLVRAPGFRPGRRRKWHRPFTAGAKTALYGARDEATKLHHRRIGPGHLLLALASGPSHDPAVTLLVRLGIDIDDLRERLLQRLVAR